LEGKEVTYLTEGQIKAAIDAWAESQVDTEIAERIQRNKEYIEKYGDGGNNRYFRPEYYPVEVDKFNRESVRNDLAEGFYDIEGEGVDLPGIGTAKLVDSYGGEGQGDDYWRVFEIAGDFYKADHYYNSYDVDPWHGSCRIFPVVGREKVVTEWVAQ
jgi:hypothetical protein